MATEFTNATDIVKNTYFTAGNVVTESDMNNVAYYAHLRNVRALMKALSFDGQDRIGVINGFGLTASGVGMSVTIAPGMIISTNDNTTVYNADHYVLASLDATDSVTITAASGNPRVDLICARPAEQFGTQITKSYRDEDGNLATRSTYPDISCPVTLVHIMGTPGADPTPAVPQYDYDIPLYYVNVPTTATVATDCTIYNIMPYFQKKAEALVKITVDIDGGVINSATELYKDQNPNFNIYGIAKASDKTIYFYCLYPKDYYDDDSLIFETQINGMTGAPVWSEVPNIIISDASLATQKGMRKISALIGYKDVSGGDAPTGDHTLQLKLTMISDPARVY